MKHYSLTGLVLCAALLCGCASDSTVSIEQYNELNEKHELLTESYEALMEENGELTSQNNRLITGYNDTMNRYSALKKIKDELKDERAVLKEELRRYRSDGQTQRFPDVVFRNESYTVEYCGETRDSNDNVIFLLSVTSSSPDTFLRIDTNRSDITAAYSELHGWYDFVNDGISEDGYLYVSSGEASEDADIEYSRYIKLRCVLNDGSGNRGKMLSYSDERYESGKEPVLIAGKMTVQPANADGETYSEPQELSLFYRGDPVRLEGDTEKHGPVTLHKSVYTVQYLGDEKGDNGERIIVMRCQGFPDYPYIRIDTGRSELHDGLYAVEGKYEFVNESIDGDGYLYLVNDRYTADMTEADELPFTAEKYIKLRSVNAFTGQTDRFSEGDYVNYGDRTYTFVGSITASEVYVNSDENMTDHSLSIMSYADLMLFDESGYDYDTVGMRR